MLVILHVILNYVIINNLLIYDIAIVITMYPMIITLSLCNINISKLFNLMISLQDSKTIRMDIVVYKVWYM